MKLSDAVEVLTTTYQSLDSVAKGLPVNAKEVADALALAKPDTAEMVALTVLQKYNPCVATDKTKQNKEENVNTNSEQ
jgi:hypothetical protein